MNPEGEPLDPALVAELQGVEDPELAAAIQASYESHLPSGAVPPPAPEAEDPELQRALELSRLEEERRQNPGAPSAPSLPMGGMGSSSSSAAPPGGVSMMRDRDLLVSPASREQEASSDRAVDGDSSRGSSRERGLAEMAGADSTAAMDRELAEALQASYAETGHHNDEEDMLRRAMEISRQEEERRQNQALREQQDQELQESILMDQMREQEEKRRRIEEEEQQRALAESRAAESRRQEEEARRRQERAAALPPEPGADDPDRVDLQIRVPDGKRVRRRFLASHTVGQVYDFLEAEGHLGDSPEACVLISTMPRKQYEDRMQTLADAGLQGQCALILETTSGA